MHLGWFTNYLTPDWNGPWSGRSSETWLSGDFHVGVAKRLEEACFDYLLLEDSSFVSNTYAGNFELELKQMSRAPKNDPMPLAAAIARETRHLGVVVTANTSFYPPFLLARLIRTLDHLTKGRIGWNVVTGAPDQALANYGLAPSRTQGDAIGRDSTTGSDLRNDHDRRYDRADEFVRLVIALWESWEEDAVIADRANDRYIESSKVHTIDFEGEWFRSRGPLNNPPSPQYRPVIAQAGGSERGKEFASKYADTIIALPKGVDHMKAFCDDVRRRLESEGRDPESCKILFLVTPTVGETDADAVEQRRRAFDDRDRRIRQRLSLMSGGSKDWSEYPLDAPLPALPDDGQSISDTFLRINQGKKFSDALADDQTEAIELVGSSETVAEKMVDTLAATGGDGFLIYSGSGKLTMRYVDEIVDGLVPVLQRGGATRSAYTADTLKGHLS